MEYTIEEVNGKIVLVVVDSSGVSVTYPLSVVAARNLNAQLTAALKTISKEGH